MAQETGYSKYVCDRCGKTAWVQAGSPEEADWAHVKRVSSGNALSDTPDTTYLMCADCKNAYLAYAHEADQDFESWMDDPARIARQRQLDKEQAEADEKARKQAEEQARQAAAQAAADADKQAAVKAAVEQQKADDEKAQADAVAQAAKDATQKTWGQASRNYHALQNKDAAALKAAQDKAAKDLADANAAWQKKLDDAVAKAKFTQRAEDLIAQGKAGQPASKPDSPKPSDSGNADSKPADSKTGDSNTSNSDSKKGEN